MPKIEVKNVYKIFGTEPSKVLPMCQEGATKEDILENTGHTVGLADVSLSIEEGETFVCMGLSGSGKSTLIRHINRLIDPTAGEVFVEGINVMQLNQKNLIKFRRHKMSMVFQRFGLFPHKTVIQNIAYGLEVQGKEKNERNKVAMEKIEAVGLNGFEYQYPNQLSGGMQQRVGLARALANDSDILLMDEPFSALDPLIRKDVQEILLEIQSELNKTVVFITHDLDEALKLGDRIAILKDGEMDQEGLPVDILLHPGTEYVKKFVEDVNRSRVLRAKHIMHKLNGIDLSKAFVVNENDFIEKFIDRVVTEKPSMIAVQDKQNKNVGCISSKRLSEILKK